MKSGVLRCQASKKSFQYTNDLGMDLGLVDGEVVVTDSNKIKAMLIILEKLAIVLITLLYLWDK